MATLEITKAKSRTEKGKWFTFEVDSIYIFKGKIYFAPKNKLYQYLKIAATDCIILK